MAAGMAVLFAVQMTPLLAIAVILGVIMFDSMNGWAVAGSVLGLWGLLLAAWEFGPSLRRWWPLRGVRLRTKGPPYLSLYPSGLLLPGLAVVSVIVLLLVSPWMTLVFSGCFFTSWLMVTGLRRRVERGERCAHCGYPATTPRWSRGLCPECGTNLDARDAVMIGRDVRSMRRVAMGGLLGAGMVAFVWLGSR